MLHDQVVGPRMALWYFTVFSSVEWGDSTGVSCYFYSKVAGVMERPTDPIVSHVLDLFCLQPLCRTHSTTVHFSILVIINHISGESIEHCLGNNNMVINILQEGENHPSSFQEVKNIPPVFIVCEDLWQHISSLLKLRALRDETYVLWDTGSKNIGIALGECVRNVLVAILAVSFVSVLTLEAFHGSSKLLWARFEKRASKKLSRALKPLKIF